MMPTRSTLELCYSSSKNFAFSANGNVHSFNLVHITSSPAFGQSGHRYRVRRILMAYSQIEKCILCSSDLFCCRHTGFGWRRRPIAQDAEIRHGR